MRSVNPDLKACTFINRADPRGQDNSEAAELLKETEALTFLAIPLGSRKAFSNAAAHGQAVTETRPQDAKACEEITALFKYIFDIENISGLYKKGA